MVRKFHKMAMCPDYQKLWTAQGVFDAKFGIIEYAKDSGKHCVCIIW